MAKVTRQISSGSIQLTPNFFLSEFTASETGTRAGIDNTPNPLVVANLFKLAALMEQVRKLLGNKVVSVSSGYRSPELNKKVGGSKTSDHMTGEAADFNCRSFGTPLQVCQAIEKSGIKFGQLIQEGNWVHISIGDKRDMLTAHFTPGKKTTYTKGF